MLAKTNETEQSAQVSKLFLWKSYRRRYIRFRERATISYLLTKKDLKSIETSTEMLTVTV